MYVDIKGLSFRYKNAKAPTIEDFDLEVAQGEIVSIQGESGSGKSTILRLIAGLETPEKGVIRVRDKVMVDDSNFINPEERGLGMLFQDYALFPHMTVEENIRFGLHKLNKREQLERVEEVLELVDMREFKNRFPHQLSGGQQQRIALARAIAPKPALLLMDEPFSNLDKDLQDKIRQELKLILKATGITTIFVTHDREDSRVLADRIVVLKGI